MKQKKWTYQIYLESDRPMQVSQNNGLKSHLLSIKTYISSKQANLMDWKLKGLLSFWEVLI